MSSRIGVVMCAVSFVGGFGHNKSASAGARKGRQMHGGAAMRNDNGLAVSIAPVFKLYREFSSFRLAF